MRKACRLATFSAVSLLGSACAGQPTRPVDALADEIADVAEPYVQARDFMGVVGVSRPGAEPTILAFGDASVELGVPNARDGVFMIGSVSKQFTAAAVLLLADDGRLTVTDSLATHLPQFAHAGQVTIHQLLTHTAGVADVYSLPSFGATLGQGGTLAAVVSELGDMPLTPGAGESFVYSNGGYTVLAALVETVSGMAYSEFLNKRVFVPLGMRDTFHHRRGPARARHVQGYDPWGARDLTPVAPVSEAYLIGSGSLWSTAADLLVWADALHGGRVLSARAYKQMTTDHGHGYGYGVSVFERFGRPTIGHDGRVAGFTADLAHYVDDDVSVAVLGNVQSVVRDRIRVGVAAAVFSVGYEPPAMPSFSAAPEDRAALAGAYAFGPAFLVTIDARDDGRLLARANQGGWSELVPLRGGGWFSRMLYAQVAFERDASGAVTGLRWGAGDNAPVGARVAVPAD